MIQYHELLPEAFAAIYRKKIEKKVRKYLGRDDRSFKLEEGLRIIEDELTNAEKQAAKEFRRVANGLIHDKDEFEKDHFISNYLVINRALNRLLGYHPYIDEEYINGTNEYLNEEDEAIAKQYLKKDSLSIPSGVWYLIIGIVVLWGMSSSPSGGSNQSAPINNNTLPASSTYNASATNNTLNSDVSTNDTDEMSRAAREALETLNSNTTREINGIAYYKDEQERWYYDNLQNGLRYYADPKIIYAGSSEIPYSSGILYQGGDGRVFYIDQETGDEVYINPPTTKQTEKRVNRTTYYRDKLARWYYYDQDGNQIFVQE